MDKETRNISAVLRAAQDSRKIEGYALLFDTPSDGLSFREIIAKGALDGILEAKETDVFALLNHDQTRGVLARYHNGIECRSLSLEVDDKGLKYSFEAPHTALGDELLENIRRGEISTSSFCFSVAEGGEEWHNTEDGEWTRIINKIGGLYDVSPVYSAAYSATSVCLRGKEAAEKQLEEAKRKAEEQKAEEQRKAELEAYLATLDETIKTLDKHE